MKTNDTWRKIPLQRAILEVIASRPEGISESKLEMLLKKEYGIEISKAEFYSTLMKLELQGLIHVESIGKELSIRPSPSLH